MKMKMDTYEQMKESTTKVDHEQLSFMAAWTGI